jgi:putative addiction module component (TIGR02574 family)
MQADDQSWPARNIGPIRMSDKLSDKPGANGVGCAQRRANAPSPVDCTDPQSEAAVSTLVEELSQRALALSPEDRARLAEELLASLDDEVDADSDVAWEDEIGRRVDDIKAGRAKLIPAEEVFAETARIYGK